MLLCRLWDNKASLQFKGCLTVPPAVRHNIYLIMASIVIHWCVYFAELGSQRQNYWCLWIWTTSPQWSVTETMKGWCNRLKYYIYSSHIYYERYSFRLFLPHFSWFACEEKMMQSSEIYRAIFFFFFFLGGGGGGRVYSSCQLFCSCQNLLISCLF